MKFETLKTIESLLRNNVTVCENASKQINEQLNKLYDVEELDTENFNSERLEFWKQKKDKHVGLLMDAKDALNDFLSHDWR